MKTIKTEAGKKIYRIIEENFDMRMAGAVIIYIIDQGWDTLTEITEEQIKEIEGNALMTQAFCQALVRTAVKICKECNHYDDFFPFIINYLYVPNAKMHEIEIWQDQMTKWRWNDLINDLEIDFEEEADEIEAVFLNVNVLEVIENTDRDDD